MKLALTPTLTLLGLALSVLGDRVAYDNYKVYRFIPKTETEREILLQLQDSKLGVSSLLPLAPCAENVTF